MLATRTTTALSTKLTIADQLVDILSGRVHGLDRRNVNGDNGEMAIERWTDYPFPPYSYVTGKFPHPLREDDGHGCKGPPHPTTAPTDKTWRQCQLYLWGHDLFAAGYYWESHEAWEGVWHSANRRGPVADLQKALIKLAAAGVKAREGRIQGVRRHGLRSEELARAVQTDTGHAEFLGVNLAALVQLGNQVASSAEELVSAASDLAAAIMPPLPLTKPDS